MFSLFLHILWYVICMFPCNSFPWGRRSSGTALRRGECLATTLGSFPWLPSTWAWWKRTPSLWSDLNNQSSAINQRYVCFCVFFRLCFFLGLWLLLPANGKTCKCRCVRTIPSKVMCMLAILRIWPIRVRPNVGVQGWVYQLRSFFSVSWCTRDEHKQVSNYWSQK